MDFRERVTLITGATGGLGAVMARMLPEKGTHVAVTHLGHRDEGVEVCREVEAKGRKSFLVHLDQTDPASCEAAVEATVSALGRLETLINNAAWNDPVPFRALDALTPEVWDRSLNTKHRRSARVGPYGKHRPSGFKGSLIHLTRCLAVALAPSITVNCVVPGLMEGTRMFARVPPERVALVKDRALLKGTTNLEDVSRQVLPFCQSDSITGQTQVDRCGNRLSLILMEYRTRLRSGRLSGTLTLRFNCFLPL